MTDEETRRIVEAERARLRDEILSDMPPATSDANRGVRVGMVLAARIVERGRKLTGKEKMENLHKAIWGDDEP